ncbi:hypothetical protein [Photobacterium leiognathi]|uniref:hypothetical protein n=1 Tax=Photobacterium leiognathi TaxID=553611 RepID=UPI002981FCB7|nr:hypothetical protein [Photobacterium leiognathi]
MMKHFLLLMGLFLSTNALAAEQTLYNTLGQIVYVEQNNGKSWVIADDIHCEAKKNLTQCKYKEGTTQRSVEGLLAKQLMKALHPFTAAYSNNKNNHNQLSVKIVKCFKQQAKNSVGQPEGDYQYQCLVEK